jgi:DNA-binding GntR family transcriptional regulator
MTLPFLVRIKKNDKVVELLVKQYIQWIEDYRIISGTPFFLPKIGKKTVVMTEGQINQIKKELKNKGYLQYDQATDQEVFQFPIHTFDFISTVSAAYREIQKSGKKPGIYTIQKQMKVVDPALEKTFGFNKGHSVMQYQRMLTANDKPIIMIEFCLSLDHLRNVDQAFQDDQPHLEFVLQKYSIQYQYLLREVSVISLPQDKKKLFHVEQDNIICTLGKFKFYNKTGNLVESGIAYLIDMHTFSTTSTSIEHLYF